MLKRIWLFLLTNIAILFVFNIVLYVLSLFGINITPDWGYASLLIFCAIFWFLGSFISLAMSKWMAKKAYKITPISPENLSDLSKKERLVWEVVENLADRNNIKMPEVGIYNDDEPNAFATGMTKNSSLVAVSSWLLDTMDEWAIEWVVGHEMAHILNGDMVTMTLLQWVVNTFVLFAAKVIANIASGFVKEEMSWIVRFLVDIALQIIFWILASLIVMKFSRWREYRADAGSAKFVWKEKMIAWLQALKDMQNRMHEEKESKFATMQISTKKASWFKQLFSSHPDLDDRIKALEELRV